MSALQRLIKARTALVQSHPFFGAVALRMQFVERPSVETMAVDGVSLFYNPAWVDEQRDQPLIGVLAHEAAHVMGLHHTRRGARDPKRWNIAGDYAINGILLKAGIELPADALHDPRFDGMGVERIYAMLPDGQDDGSKGGASSSGADDQASAGESDGDADDGQSQDPGGCGGVMDFPGEAGDASPAEIAQQEADVQIATVQAANVARAAGRMPADAGSIVENVKRAHVDWVEETRRFVQAIAKDDYSWTRPNRRFISRGLHLPSLRSERMGPMVIAVDTSGSVFREQAEFMAQARAIVQDVRPERVYVVWCDTRIQRVDEFEPDDFPEQLTGPRGGGTLFQPVFDWVDDQEFDPACLVYLTDLYGDRPADPGYPVLWASTTDQPAPCGDVVRVRV